MFYGNDDKKQKDRDFPNQINLVENESISKSLKSKQTRIAVPVNKIANIKVDFISLRHGLLIKLHDLEND